MPAIDKKTYYKIKSELYKAVEANDVPRITELLSRGLGVEVRDHENRTPLHQAAIKNIADSHFDTISALLKNKASINIRDIHRKTALHYAAGKSDFRTIKLLLDHKAKINIRNEKADPPYYTEPESPLFEAIRCNNFEVVRLLVERGSNVNQVAEYGETSLHRACSTPKVNFDTVELLLTKGAKVDAVFGYLDSLTPLHCLSGHGDVDTVRLLLEHKADVNFKDKKSGETPFFKAIRGGNTEVVKLLVEYGSSVNHQAVDDVSPLHVACCESGNPAIVEVLLKSGAEVNAKGCHGETPLHIAVRQNKVELVRLLLDHGVDVEVLDNQRRSALFNAVQYADVEIVQILLDLGLNPNSRDAHGSTLMHEACRRSKNFEVVKMLLKKGARVDIRDSNGRTPLYHSTIWGEVRTFQLLLDSGASRDNEKGLLLNAVRCGNFEMAQILLEESGLDVNSKSVSLLEACAKSSNYRMIDMLLKSGAKVEAVNVRGLSALHYTVLQGDVKATKLLLDHNADVNCVNKFGETALFSAVRDNNVEMVKLLLDHDSDVNCVNESYKKTPLHYVAEESVDDNHYEVIRLLLERKADLEAVDEDGKKPLDYLIRNTNVRTIELALKFGASSRLTPECILFDMLRHRFFENAQVLVDYGYDLDDVDIFEVMKPPCTMNCRHLELNKFYFKNSHLDEKWLIRAFAQQNESSELMKFWLKYTDINDIADDENDNILNLKPLWSYFEIAERPPNIWKMILKHIAKLQALEIQVHPSLVDTIVNNNDYNDYFKLCENELTVAKNRRIDSSWITFFDLLVGSKRKLKNYAGNRDLMDAFEKSDYETVFPSYKNQIQNNVKKGVRRRKFYDKASILLSELLPIFNPMHLVIRDTLDCISTKDLSKFCN